MEAKDAPGTKAKPIEHSSLSEKICLPQGKIVADMEVMIDRKRWRGSEGTSNTVRAA
jgi:hypothetical protein